VHSKVADAAVRMLQIATRGARQRQEKLENANKNLLALEAVGKYFSA
jgi:hypothetical protein